MRAFQSGRCAGPKAHRRGTAPPPAARLTRANAEARRSSPCEATRPGLVVPHGRSETGDGSRQGATADPRLESRRVRPPPDMNPPDARLELARRYLHVFGPSATNAFSGWAGITARARQRDVRGTLARADPGADPDRRLADPHHRRGRVPRLSSTHIATQAAAERRRLLPSVGRGSGTPRRRPQPSRHLVDPACLAGRSPRRGRDRGHVATVTTQGQHPRLGSSAPKGDGSTRVGKTPRSRCPGWIARSMSAGTIGAKPEDMHSDRLSAIPADRANVHACPGSRTRRMAGQLCVSSGPRSAEHSQWEMAIGRSRTCPGLRSSSSTRRPCRQWGWTSTLSRHPCRCSAAAGHHSRIGHDVQRDGDTRFVATPDCLCPWLTARSRPSIGDQLRLDATVASEDGASPDLMSRPSALLWAPRPG
jgi:hypothetical protein